MRGPRKYTNPEMFPSTACVRLSHKTARIWLATYLQYATLHEGSSQIHKPRPSCCAHIAAGTPLGAKRLTRLAKCPPSLTRGGHCLLKTAALSAVRALGSSREHLVCWDHAQPMAAQFRARPHGKAHSSASQHRPHNRLFVRSHSRALKHVCSDGGRRSPEVINSFTSCKLISHRSMLSSISSAPG